MTGVVLGHPKSEKLLNAKQIGQDELKNWFKRRVVGESDFWATLPKLNVETFASLNKPIKYNVSKSDEVVSQKADRDLFGKLLVAAGKRRLDLQEVLKYELSPVPMSLYHLNGDMRKTTKIKLLQELEFDTDAPSIIHTYT